MYIVAIAWLYVILMMALTERSIVAGIATVLFYGLLPLALFLWLAGTPQRRRNKQAARRNAMTVPEEAVTAQQDPLKESGDMPTTPQPNDPATPPAAGTANKSQARPANTANER